MSTQRLEHAIKRIEAAIQRLPQSFEAADSSLLEKELDKLATQDRKQRHALKQSAERIDTLIQTIDGAISGNS